MLLVLTSTDDATADHLCSRLVAEDLPLIRINTDTFAREGFVEYARGAISLRMKGESFAPDGIRNVWHRRPRGVQVGRGPFSESQTLHLSREWGASLDCFLAHVPAERWMNHPAANAHASNKLLQLTVAREVGLTVPDTLVTSSRDDALSFLSRHGGHVVAKPLSVGYVETAAGVVEGQIYTSHVAEENLDDAGLLARCPTLLQQQLTKAADVRVTIVDRRVTAIDLLPESPSSAPVDIRESDPRSLTYEPVALLSSVELRILELMDRFGLRFGAIDLVRTTTGEYVFLEINPNGQWAWMDLIGASDIARTFVEAFRGA